MPSIPAVCGSCGAIFPSGISVGQGVEEVYISDNSQRCPVCGAQAKVLSGRADSVRGGIRILFDENVTVDVIVQLEQMLSGARSAGADPEEVRRQLAGSSDERVRRLADLVPKTRADFYFWIGAVIALLAIWVQHADASSTPVRSEEEISRVVAEVFERMETQPPAPVVTTTTPAASAGGRRGRVGRNDPCGCGSGVKYKYCHGRR